MDESPDVSVRKSPKSPCRSASRALKSRQDEDGTTRKSGRFDRIDEVEDENGSREQNQCGRTRGEPFSNGKQYHSEAATMITPTIAPTMAETMHQSFALAEAACAPA